MKTKEKIEKNKGGRPKGVKIPLKEFKDVIEDYIAECLVNKVTPLVQEACLKVGISRETMDNYRQLLGYRDVIKRLDEISEIGWIRYAEATNKPIFPIFMLKAKYNYQEAATRLDVKLDTGVVTLPINPDKTHR